MYMSKLRISSQFFNGVSPSAWLGSLFLLGALTACGGGSSGGDGDATEYKGKTTAAAVSESNKEDLAVAASQGSSAAISQGDTSSLPTSVVVAGGLSKENRELVQRISQGIAESAAQGMDLAVGAKVDIAGDCGGKAVFESNASGTNFSINYRDYCIAGGGDNVVFNGVFDYEEKGDFSFYRYRNFVVRSNGETQRIDNLTIKCSTSGGFGIDCEVISDFAGTNGRTYRISNASFSGSKDSGYNVEARVFDGNHGYIDITATGLVPCNSGGFSSGSIDVTDSTGDVVLEVVFVSCSEMTVTFGGNSETITQ